ncbi:hypothetical protein CLAIMM_11755 [Cladophialophora immunda]|nr:hypothetical protein CLAIMM_11755 [Cladophialophora immunda]
MGLGILEPKTSLQHVPGTTLLDVHDQAAVDTTQFLKKGTGRNAHVVLIPQPSHDPRDPLNWPLWQRDCILLLYGACTIATIGLGPILSPVVVPLMMEFKVSFTDVSLLSGYNLCATGAIGIFMACLCRKWGKRPGFLLSMTFAFGGSLWAACAHSYGSLLGARVMQGLSMSFFESIVFSVIGDLYFVHERGKRMAVYICSLSAITNIPVLVAGTVQEVLGWRWIFWIYSLFLGVLWLLSIFFGWETAFNRDVIYEVDVSSHENLHIIEEMKAADAEVWNDTQIEHADEANALAGPRDFPRHRRLAPINGTYSPAPIVKMAISPFLVVINPAVIWSALTVAFPVLWVVGISLVTAQIFSAPPFLLTPKQLGYMSGGPVVLGTLANLVCGLISDSSVKWLSRRNGGIYEPEFRLFLMIGLAICAALGYYLMGYVVKVGGSVVAASVCYGITVAGCQFSAVCAGTYMVDAFRALSIDVFIFTMIFKNFLYFGFSYILNDWVTMQGPTYFFYTVGGIQLGLTLLTVPLYFYGKKVRAWWHVQPIAQKF